MFLEYIKLLIKIKILKLQRYDSYDTNIRLHPKTIEKLKKKYKVVEEGKGIRYHIVIIWRKRGKVNVKRIPQNRNSI